MGRVKVMGVGILQHNGKTVVHDNVLQCIKGLTEKSCKCQTQRKDKETERQTAYYDQFTLCICVEILYCSL